MIKYTFLRFVKKLKHEKYLLFSIFIVLCTLLLFINVGTYGVVESSDARYAEISREMLESGDYIHPTLLNIQHYHKPPLTYQLTALGYQIFGVNELGARFFLQLSLLIQLLLVYALSNILFGNRGTALWAAIIYFSFPLTLISTRNLTTDSFLATFVLLSIYSWVKYRKYGKFRYLYLTAISLALGFYTKGPVVLLVPLVFIIAYNRIEKSKNRFGVHHLLSLVVFLGISLWWFVFLIRENGSFADYFLGRQTVERFGKDVFNRSEPFWYFVAFAPLVGLPWLLILPYLMVQNRKSILKKGINSVLTLSFLIPLVFFSISTSKRILYILPFYSILAMLTANLLANLISSKEKVIDRSVTIFSMIVLLVATATMFIHTNYVIPKGVGIASILLIVVILAIYRYLQGGRKFKPVLVSFLVSGFLLITSGLLMQKNELEFNISRPISNFIKSKNLQDRNILIYNTMKPSIAFDMRKPVISLYDGSNTLAREVQFEENSAWKSYFYDLTDSIDTNRLKGLMERPSVLVSYKHPLPENRQWLAKRFSTRKDIGKWHIYY